MMPVAPIPPVFKKANHALHLVLTLFTCGMWLFVWLIAAGVAASDNRAKVREYDRQVWAYRGAHR